MIDADDIFGTVGELVAFVTGEIIFAVVTLGRHKPRWDFYEKKPTVERELRLHASTWIGFIFWVAVIVAVVAAIALFVA